MVGMPPSRHAGTMTDTTSAGEAGPDFAAPPPPPPRSEAAFFTWLRSLGIVRDSGWLGGVCSGTATRLGIDPLIVRGIFVVVALVGFPALLVYALGWALLPDADRRIHLQELGRGRFDPTLIAIAIMALLSLVPVMQWAWSTVFWPFGVWGFNPLGPLPALNSILVFLVVASAIALTVWLVVRTVRDPAMREPADAVAPARAPATVPTPATATGEQEKDPPAPSNDTAPTEPVRPAEYAPEDEVAQWRASHEQWRTEHEAWRQRLVAADAAARERARRERAAASRAFAAEAAERRRIREATRPRVSEVFVLVVLGAALVAGALCALRVGEPAVGAPAGLLVAGLVVALGMVVAGALRRRSGFLASVAAATVIAGLVSGFLTSTPALLPTSASISTITSTEQHFLQPTGEADIHLFDVTSSAEPTEDFDPFEAGVISLRKGTGDTTIWVQPGTTLVLDVTLREGGGVEAVHKTEAGKVLSTVPLSARMIDGAAHFEQRINGAGAPGTARTVVPVQIDQLDGSVTVIVNEPEED